MGDIIQVLPSNYREVIDLLREKLVTYPNICIDTSFKGINPSKDNALKSRDDSKTSETERYEVLKCNVSYTNLREVGITVCDNKGIVGGTWRFDTIPWKRSKKFKIEACDCIPFDEFADELKRIMEDFHGKVKWVTFSGFFDIAYLIALLTKQPLPGSISEFVELVGQGFGRVYDLKMVAKGYDIFGPNTYLGLQKLADMTGVKRVGKPNDTGSDSLITAGIFAHFNRFNMISDIDGGFLYLVSERIQYVPKEKSSKKFGHEKITPPMPMEQEYVAINKLV